MDANNELIRNLEKLADTFTDNLADNFKEVRDAMQAEAEDKVPVDTGALKTSIDFKVEKSGNDSVGINLNVEKLEDYWADVEFGTRPQPYLRPAVDKGIEKITEKVQDAFIKSI